MKLRFAIATAFALVFAFPMSAVRAGETTTIPATSGGSGIPAYIARPAGSAAAPAVLVLHGCEGYTPHYAGIADWIASKGYVAVAIDSLAPLGIRNACGDVTGSRTEAAAAVTALDWMRTQQYIDGSRMALLGYSMGAIAALDIVDPWHATPPPPGLVAAVVYYPACRKREAASINLPVRILDGDADDWTPAPPCKTLAEAGTAAGKLVTITTYPGATHAFNVDAADRLAYGHHMHYDAAAAADAETQTLAFLRTYLRPAP